MAIQKQITQDETIKQSGKGLGVSLDSINRKGSSSVTQSDRNVQEIAAYSNDIRKSLLVGGLVILVEIALYFFKIIR
jgi:hypothetical protein